MGETDNGQNRTENPQKGIEVIIIRVYNWLKNQLYLSIFMNEILWE